MRLIDADVLTEEFWKPEYRTQTRRDFISVINKFPTIDPVHFAGGTYCKECIYYKPYEFPESGNIIYQCYNSSASYLEEHKPNDFCSKGKKGNPKNA